MGIYLSIILLVKSLELMSICFVFGRSLMLRLLEPKSVYLVYLFILQFESLLFTAFWQLVNPTLAFWFLFLLMFFSYFIDFYHFCPWPIILGVSLDSLHSGHGATSKPDETESQTEKLMTNSEFNQSETRWHLQTWFDWFKMQLCN